MLVEVQEVVSLNQLVGELGERHAVASFAGEALLYRILAHHVVYGDVLTHVADEIEERELLHPVVVVYQLGTVGRVAFEVEELSQLRLDALLVVAKGCLVEQVALYRLARWVANHPRCTTH